MSQGQTRPLLTVIELKYHILFGVLFFSMLVWFVLMVLMAKFLENHHPETYRAVFGSNDRAESSKRLLK